jgi:hypothetical protein
MLMMAVEHFHARKFKEHNRPQGEERAVLKVVGAGSNKKQNTLVKPSMQEAFRSLVHSGNDGQGFEAGQEEPMETSKVVSGMEAQPLEADPKKLPGSHGESRREK